MSIIEEILEHNAKFVENKDYENFISDKYPSKKLAILSCMDTRLTELIPAALNIKNGEVKIIKNAGAVISHPFGSVIRSLLVAIYQLGVKDIMVLGHTECGMQNMDTSELVEKMIERKIPQEKIDMLKYCGVDIYSWLKGFDSVEDSVRNTVQIIREHILIPKDINTCGFIIDIHTGKLTKVD